MTEKMTQLLELLEREEGLAQELFELQEAEEAQALLKEKGLEVSTEDLTAFRGALQAYYKQGEGALSEEELEEVAGGFSINDLVNQFNKGKDGAGATWLPDLRAPRIPRAPSSW